VGLSSLRINQTRRSTEPTSCTPWEAPLAWAPSGERVRVDGRPPPPGAPGGLRLRPGRRDLRLQRPLRYRSGAGPPAPERGAAARRGAEDPLRSVSLPSATSATWPSARGRCRRS